VGRRAFAISWASRSKDATPRDRALFPKVGSTRARAEEAFSKQGEGKSKKRGRKIKGKGRKIQIFCFRQSRLFNGLGQGINNLAAIAQKVSLDPRQQAP
jgi:hypothetical protein